MQLPLREHLRSGLAAALLFGALLGWIAGIALIMLEHVDLILPGAQSRFLVMLFLVSFVAAILVVLLLPIEVAMARFLIHAGFKFYFALLAAGAVVVYTVLWAHFRGFHLSHVLVCIVAATAVLLAYRSGKQSPSRKRIPANALLALFVAALLCAAFTYQRLSAQPELRGGTQPLTASGSEKFAVPQTAPNIVLISIDTLRADHVGAYGYPRGATPGIDRLAEESVLFQNAYTAAPWTLPSHASLLTGLYPFTHGARFSSQHAPVVDKLDSSIRTMAEILYDGGYSTGAFTSVFWLSNDWGMLQGFQAAESHTAAPADRIVNTALDWLHTRQRRPYFLFLHFFDVHEFTSPPDFEARFREGAYDGPLKKGPLLTSKSEYYSNLNDSDMQYLKAKYDGALLYVDSQLARLRTALETAGEWNNTIFIVTSDHGEEFLDHGATGHGFTLYQEAVRVPLILKLPGVSPRRVDEDVSLVDVLPTVMDYASLPSPRSEGVTLRPAIERRALPRRLLFSGDTYFMNSWALLDQGWKFIDHRIPPADLLNARMLLVNLRAFFKFSGPELYNVTSDPGERTNLAAHDNERVRQMRSIIASSIAIRNVGEQGELEEEAREKMKAVGYVQ